MYATAYEGRREVKFNFKNTFIERPYSTNGPRKQFINDPRTEIAQRKFFIRLHLKRRANIRWLHILRVFERPNYSFIIPHFEKRPGIPVLEKHTDGMVRGEKSK